MSKIIAYIHFKNNCREVMHFYQACLGGTLNLMTVKDSPMKDKMPPNLQDIILHASLENGDLTLLGSEMPENDSSDNTGHSISLMLHCDSREELEDKFKKLSAGGTVTYPIEDFFAGKIGNLTDQFGFKWSLFCPEH